MTAVLAACAGIGTAAYTLGISSDASSRPDCQRADYVAPTPGRAPVNVYNSTPQGGLATNVASELKKRGFTIGEVDNDPLRRKIRGTGEIRGGPAGEAQIAALQAWQPGMVIVRDKGRRGPGVDFVMGLKFVELRAEPEAPPGAPPSACLPVTEPASS
ncbi:MAG: LytR C-terminal domain-containing protein [Sporichthyaceae bacterium]